MSQEKPRKRDRVRTFFSGSPTHISRPDLPSTSVLGAAVGPNETTTSSTRAPLPSTRARSPSTQQFAPPTEPSVEAQPGDTTRDAILKPNPSQPVSTSATATAKDTAHTQIGKEWEPIPTATSHTKVLSLWSRAFKGGEMPSPERELSTQERKTLADIGIVRRTPVRLRLP